MTSWKRRNGSLLAAVVSSALLGCESPPTDVNIGLDTIGDPVPEEGAMRGFSWVIDGQLAGMPKLGVRQSLDQDMGFLEGQGIDVLISLTIQPISDVRLETYGIERLHWPIKDFSAPTMEQMVEFAKVLQKRLDDGHMVGIHCTAGLGRTGTMIAVHFVASGMAAEDAIEEVRAIRPGSIETASQEAAIAAFADLLVVAPNTLN